MHVFGCEPRQQPPHDANVELGFQVQAQVSRRQHVNRRPAAQPCSLAHGGHTSESTVTDVERRPCSTCAYVKYVIGTSTARCDHAMQAVRLNTMHDCCYIVQGLAGLGARGECRTPGPQLPKVPLQTCCGTNSKATKLPRLRYGACRCSSSHKPKRIRQLLGVVLDLASQGPLGLHGRIHANPRLDANDTRIRHSLPRRALAARRKKASTSTTAAVFPPCVSGVCCTAEACDLLDARSQHSSTAADR